MRFSQTAVPTILMIDKNHSYNTFDRQKGLKTDTHGWSFTIASLRAEFQALQQAEEVKGVDLQFLALTVRELFTGLDYDPVLWPHPFLPEAMLELLHRAKHRTGHATRSNAEEDWAIRIIRFLKLFTRNEVSAHREHETHAP